MQRISQEQRRSTALALVPREYSYLVGSCVAIFYGGPINGETHAMQEPYPTWNVPVLTDLAFGREAFVEEDPADIPEIETYHYERQFWFSSEGHVVYLCVD